MAQPTTSPRTDETAALPGSYAGKLLRVDLGTGRTWAQPWTAAEMRFFLGGVGLGAKVLWEEVPPEVGWDHPDNRLVLATGPFAGLPVWGTGGLTVITRGAMTNGATSTQANGFFGANLKFSGYDAIVLQGQAPAWVYLYIHDDEVDLRDAGGLLGKDTWETQDALSAELGLAGHMLSVYSIGPAGEKLVRFAAIQGDYGHVASKNGVGAVMGKKKLKAVAIVRGTRAIRAVDPRGVYAAADEISYDLRTNPAARTLYEYGTLPGVVNLHGLGALPIKNYTTSVAPAGVDMKQWEAPALREGFDHRGAPARPAPGRHRGRAGVRGLVRRRLDHRLHRPGRGVLAQHPARPRLRGRQRVRLALRLGHGVPGEGLHHRAAARLPPRVG
jgi:aldehyde:ferredoxin oxidoreductase